MSDLVQRLRALSQTGNSLALGPGQQALREAADTIEIMAREIADLKAQHLLSQAEEMHRTLAAAQRPSRRGGGYSSGSKPASELEPPPQSKGLGAK